MSSRSRNNSRSTRRDIETAPEPREPYAILWLGGREIRLYGDEDTPVTGENPLY